MLILLKQLVNTVIILNKQLVLERAQEKGLRSFSDLARAIDVHRNTLQRYLGGESIVSGTVEKIISHLNLTVDEVMIKVVHPKPLLPVNVALVLKQLNATFPDISFVLFGSRARRKFHKYSDFDIGLYSTNGIELEEYLKIVEKSEQLSENLPYAVDLTNLTQADEEFLNNISGEAIFLGGKIRDRLELGTIVQ